MIPMYRAPYKTEHQPLARLNVHWDNTLGMIAYVGISGDQMSNPRLDQPMCKTMVDVINLAAKRGELFNQLQEINE